MSLHLIRVTVPQDDRAWLEMVNPNAWKGLLWRIFDKHSLPENSGGYVFRKDLRGENVVFTVMSPYKPNVEAYGSRPIRVDSRVIEEASIDPGNEFHFVSRLCPTKTAGGKRIPIVEELVPEWLSKQITGEATLKDCCVTGSGIQKSYKDGEVITHYWVDVEGSLVVEETKSFIERLGTGVGRAKRYGLGMIVLINRV